MEKGIPFFNWSLNKGDLRVAHLLGTHAQQALPIVSFYALRNLKWTLVVAGFYFLLAAITWAMALQGRPLVKVV